VGRIKKNSMKNIILLNPPGKNLYIRDYYCSKISQANYINQPIDLLVISAWFKGKDYDIKLVDAIVEKLSPGQALKKIKDLKPDYIISLVGAVSWEEDIDFLGKVKQSVKCKIIGTGDILLENPEKYLNELNIFDAVITDFTTNEIGEYIKTGTKEKKVLPQSSSRNFHLAGNPYHELFLKLKYRYPFTTGRKYCTALTSFGCPFKCSFCIMGKLSYKMRELQSIMEELKYIKSLGVKEIFFLDQTFGANKQKTKELLNKIIEEKLNIKWFSFSRVDVLDEEMLLLMKKSGCHTLIFGIESGSDKILTDYRKGYTKEDIKRTLGICAKLKIRTAGTFIFGLPDETAETAEETLEFIKELPLDYASFNVAVPRAGTDLREQAISLGLIDKNFVTMDQSGTEVSMSTRELSQEEVKAIKRKAVFNFYFRSKYIMCRLFKIRTPYEFIQNFLNAVNLFKLNK
jgi:anaerobic magnesium-protoporphyrin IX monomethyl ester cyclase